MHKTFLLISGISGALSVAIGAFGAHGLRAFLEANNRFDTFETAVRYQFYHTFALLIVALLMNQLQNKTLEWAGWCYVLGMLIFSGSLYLLCATGIKWLGAVTPIGGLFFIAGWLLLALGVLKHG
jgi:uncharacterized membrane protein YgdD (TMEM256/DUF423 family)